eukprot:Hpha_TRINITY_DN11159_c1_g1::TRINITY_DN11159_c1_g1_i1::g.28021::m.28021/K07359/CAMKK2; calcium/calmodulin-dependent protein kinase kinase 2
MTGPTGKDPKEWLREVQAPRLIEAAVSAAVEQRPHDLLGFFAEHFAKAVNARGTPVDGSLPKRGLTVDTNDGPAHTPRPENVSNVACSAASQNLSPEGSPGRSPVAVQSELDSPAHLQEQLRRAQMEVIRLEGLLQRTPASGEITTPVPAGEVQLARHASEVCEDGAIVSPSGARRQVQVMVPKKDVDDASWRRTSDDGFTSPRSGAGDPGIPPTARKRISQGQSPGRTASGIMLGRNDTLLKKNEKLIGARACVVCGRDDMPGEERKSGFKCFGCVGIPSNPHFVKQLESGLLKKGRTTDGDFVVNDYTIIKELGRGAFGKVRLVMHNKSNQAYAAKVLPKSALKMRMMPTRTGQTMSDPLQRAKEEVMIMAKLKHANVIQIYGTMENDCELMIIMEYLERGAVFTSSYPAEPLALPKLQRYCTGIARGLQYLHDHGVIHRDIKPDNILLDARDNVKLADFGVSSQVGGDDEETATITGFTGTPHFMPPEAFDSDSREGEPTDVWAFGVTAYAMSFGKLPPWGRVKQLASLCEAIRAADVPYGHRCPLVDHLLRKMLNKKPEKRINVDGILQHPLFATIRIVKGQPVENVEVALDWDKEAGVLKVTPCEEEDYGGTRELDPATGQPLLDLAGMEMFTDFFDQSQSRFQITQGNEYSITLYDVRRDPRRDRLRETLSGLERSAQAKKERRERKEREDKEGEEREQTDPTAPGPQEPEGGLAEEKQPSTWADGGVKESEWDDSDLEDGLS